MISSVNRCLASHTLQSQGVWRICCNACDAWCPILPLYKRQWQPLPNWVKIALQFDNLSFHMHHAHLLGRLCACIAHVPMLVQGSPSVTMGTNFSRNGRSRGTTCSGGPFISWHPTDMMWSKWGVCWILLVSITSLLLWLCITSLVIA